MCIVCECLNALGDRPPVEGPISELVMADLVDKADQDLARHRLAEAETSFHAVLTNITVETSNKERHIIKSLRGLAEIYLKRSRSTRHDLYKWHCMYLVSMAMQRLLVQYCDIISSLDQDDNMMLYIEEVRSKSQHSLKGMEDKLLKSMETELCPSDKTGKKKDGSLNLEWLTTLHMFCLTKVKEISELADSRLCESHSSKGSDISSIEDRSCADFEEFDDTHKLKITQQIDFKRVQIAIMKLVKQISKDVRSRYIREHLPEDMLRQSVTSEMMCMLSPEAAPKDIAALFEQALDGPDPEDVFPELEEKITDSKPAVRENEKSDRTWAYPLDRDAKLKLFQQGPKKWQWDSVESEAELITSTTESGDDIERLPGVLTVWKAYKNVRSSDTKDKVAPYTLQIFEEVSPLTELGKHINNEEACSNTSSDNASLVYQNSPLNMDAFNVTLAHVLTRLADRMKEEKHLDIACELYKYSLGIFEDAGIKRQEFGSVGHILRHLASIKCGQKDVNGGSSLFHEARAMFEKRDSGEISLDLAQCWFDQGVAYMSENGHEGPLFHHVMEMVKDNYEGHIRHELLDIDDDDTDSECSEGESYPLSLCEAIDSFNHALAIIRKLRKHNQLDDSLYVDVLTKLGDCSMMMGAFDRAVLYYEEALILFRNAQSATALPNNAHVLSMMGIANFFLGNFPKAVTMFDTAHILHQHLCSTEASFEMAFTLTMLGMSYYLQRQYHRSIAWCSKAYEIYTVLYNNKHSEQSSLHQWFIAQTLYVLGFSYSTLEFLEKAMKYVVLCEELLLKMNEEDRDVKLLVKVLKVKADIFSMMDDQENSLFHYQQALEYSQSLGDEKSANALQNQLLNSMASLHVSTKQYSTAAMYLEQALDHQHSMEKSIHGDLVGILSQLGLTYSLSGDLDRAIDCYCDCVDAIRESSSSPNLRHASIFGSLATLYHVKACIQDDNDTMVEILQLADKKYREALSLDSRSTVAVQYANYLHQQGHPADALDRLLPFVFGALKRNAPDVVYNGAEQAILPEHFQHELDDTDEARLDCRFYATFLALLCFKELGLAQDAEDCLVILYQLATNSQVALNQTILGYALLEMHMYAEAAEAFAVAGRGQFDNEASITNMWLSLCCGAYSQVALGAYLAVCHNLQEKEKLYKLKLKEEEEQAARARDSGYYDNMEIHTNGRKIQASAAADEVVDPGFVSTENLEHVDEDSSTLANKSESEEEWVMEEGVMETPTELLQQDEQDKDGEEEDWVTEEGFMETPSELVKQESHQVMQEEGAVDQGSEDEWITEEGVMETPSQLMEQESHNVIQDEREVNQESEDEWVTEEGVMDTPSEFTQQGSPFEDTEKQESDEEWVTEEGVMETPVGILQDFESQYVIEEKEKEEEEEEWRVIEETVTTPVAILQAMGASTDRTDEGDSEFDSKAYDTLMEQEEVFTTPAVIVEPDIPEEDLTDSGEWRTEEVVVETPAEVLAMLQRQQGLQRVPSSEEMESMIQQQQQILDAEERYLQVHAQHHRRLSSEDSDDSTVQQEGERGDENEEQWETIEETVETPVSILRMLKNNNNYSNGLDSNYIEENGNSQVYTTDIVQNKSTSNTTLDNVKTENREIHSESSESHSLGQVEDSVSMGEQASDGEETWETWEEEETVETPPEILQAILAGQMR